jgi:hypothetical protein
MQKLQFENFYNHVKDDDDDELRHYPNEKLMNIKLPARMLVLGPSSSGKTNIVMGITKYIGIWDKVILLAKNLEEKLYKHFIKCYRAVEKKTKQQMLLAINDMNDLPEVEDNDPKENTLFICDDFINEKQTVLDSKLAPYFTQGRKNGVTSIFLSQSYYRTPMIIRQNVSYVLIKKLASAKDLSRILAEYTQLGVTADELMKLYHNAIEGDFTNFLTLDIDTYDPRLRIRKCLSPME